MTERPSPSPTPPHSSSESPTSGPAAPGAPATALPDLAGILASIGHAAYGWDIASDRLVWDAGAGAVLGIDPAEISTGRHFARFLAEDSRDSRFDAVLNCAIADSGSGVGFDIHYAIDAPGRDRRWIEDTGRWFAGADGRPTRAVGVVRLATDRHERESRLVQLTQFDRLTGDSNRAHFCETLESAIEDATRLRRSCCLLILSIDRLDQLNDAYGFDIADAVIATVASRLRARLRGEDVLGRFAGNKFTILLRNCTVEEMSVAAERLAAAVREEVVVTPSGSIAVAVTIGGIGMPRHARDAAEAVVRAQEALHDARARRAGSIAIYRPSIEREARRRENARAADEIMAALASDRIALAFEPVVETTSRQPAFHECLMRMMRADGSPIAAGQIIPTAERLGLVSRLDHRVLELAMAELVAAPTLNLSLNISASSTGDPEWWGALTALLRAHPGAAERLIVEITETAEIRDIDEARGFVSRVKDLGCRIAIDDFGAGFTSFRHLRKLSVDIVKVDGAFIQNLCRSEDDRIFVRSLLGLGRDLGIATVAEWVQDEACAALLAGWGCDYLQGALAGRASRERPWLPDAAGNATADAAPASLTG